MQTTFISFFTVLAIIQTEKTMTYFLIIDIMIKSHGIWISRHESLNVCFIRIYLCIYLLPGRKFFYRKYMRCDIRVILYYYVWSCGSFNNREPGDSHNDCVCVYKVYLYWMYVQKLNRPWKAATVSVLGKSIYLSRLDINHKCLDE